MNNPPMNQPHDTWAAFYDFVYDRTYGHVYAGATEKTLQVINEIMPTGSIIDYGAGTGIIANYRMMLDYKARVVEFSKHEIPFSGREHGISSFMGIPVVELSVNEQTVKCFLDTGARLSYLSSSFTNGQPVVSTEEDFYPSLGTFTTECHDMLTHFDGHGFVVRYGTPPQMIQMLLQMAGADGIIGFDFFTNHKVLLDLNRQLLMVEKHGD